VEVLPGDALRVTVRMARPWTFRPGQHAYLYMPSIGLWTNHPFSLAWSEEEEDLNVTTMIADEKGLPMNRQDILESQKTNMSFIIRRRTGFTEKLYKKADLAAAGKFSTTAFVEGPYGECRSLLPQTAHFIDILMYIVTTKQPMLMTCYRWRRFEFLWYCHALGGWYWYHSPTSSRARHCHQVRQWIHRHPSSNPRLDHPITRAPRMDSNLHDPDPRSASSSRDPQDSALRHATTEYQGDTLSELQRADVSRKAQCASSHRPGNAGGYRRCVCDRVRHRWPC
jgi:hypothetical protein